MDAIILDRKIESNKTCYLVKVSLEDYILSLPEDYKSYYVQREIVNNPYLDNLINTVLSESHIPSIVLIIESHNLNDAETLKVNSFKILDGLQRTHRLKVIWDTIQLLKSALKESEDILNYNRIKISREFSDKISKIESSSNILSKLIDYQKNHKSENIEEKFKNNFIWFEIWSGLTPNEEVQKMLILNAGHKPVKTKHQLELLFNNLVPIINKNSIPDFKLIKEKETSSIQYSKKRTVGHFHFSHIISAILSYEAGKPITANVNLIQKTQSDDFNDAEFEIKYDYEFFNDFIDILVRLDKVLSLEYKETGIQWFGREITLVGLFAASGKIVGDKLLSFADISRKINDEIILRPEKLNLIEFESTRNGLDLSKINIGTVNKNAVSEAMYDLLNGKIKDSINWRHYFKVDTDDNK